MRSLPVALSLAFAEPQERITASMGCSRLTQRYCCSQLQCAPFVEIAAGVVRERRPLSATLAAAHLAIGRNIHDQQPGQVG